ncbi:hypothetical protein DTO027B5_5865 [Paecilomyces variotii]|nr:hypothetical protein DTO169C6_1394 [Paecilomyces variotii]KAJ9237593.1 hypothetical protein DTO169E5_5179 [Paecilomyces variotii]KAJ9266539.1 hypothetical protein DTO195F2_1062 [Paecilomyces variotii]KAJ9329225.1 hypothetical protein DTO027B3_625 [Paecilomyces variotii]KAJ9332391.1 hypothetical protein DTO027B5_5865 [Paecilomyces variotii]
MAAAIDFNALKARTMVSSNDEEAVTVDTRGLISKVLSRYSGKWTVLREMIQNAADASATRVTIKFETLPSTTVPLPNPADPSTLLKHTISHHTLKRLLISNNGAPFSEKDWARLKRIADGNPDETKIGAFGVGFYSVFDDCEEPFVSSGGQAMAFYWKGNALFTRRLQVGEAEANPDTTFVLDYRNDSSPVPSLMQLAQFLATSLTFVGLESIDLWLDDWNVLKLTKKTAPSVNVVLPRDIETKTAEGLMKVTSVSREVAQIDANWMRAVEWKQQSAVAARLEGSIRDTTGSLRTFFSRFTSSSQNTPDKAPNAEKTEPVTDTDDLTKISTASVFLHINTASVQASVSQSLSNELERATRKPPPKKTSLAILTPSYDANIATVTKSEILSSVLPSKSGRIFIGFPTHQTTGLNAHISAPSVIPTVERESIDLNTRYISKWNHEMLRAAGIVCRIAWSAEMASLKSRIMPTGGSSKVRKEDIAGVLPEAIHTTNQFAFRESTPSSLLGQIIEDAFWMCNKNAYIEVLSSRGVLPTHQVRIAPKELTFMDSIPVLPEELVLGAAEFVRKLTDFGLVTDVTVSDIKRELEASALTSKQLSEFLAWISRKAASGDLDQATVKALLRVAVANDESSAGVPSGVLVLAEIDSYLNPQRIPADLPLPASVMPFKYTKALGKRELDALGWLELQTVPWIRWLIENAGDRSVLKLEQDMTRTPSFSAQVLPVLSKQWDGLSQSSKQTIVGLLQPQTIVPTKVGMRRPPEAYFTSVRLFDDLPTVHGLNSVKEKFLAALGVRKTVELGVIFERLLNDSDTAGEDDASKKKWSHVDLIKYLASVREDIPSADIQKLKNTKICTAESVGQSAQNKRVRYQVSELYEPKDSLRNLGLPLLEWPGKYQSGSVEGRFLNMLGLKAYPSAVEIIQLMVDAAVEGNMALHSKALSYFICEHHLNGYAAFDCTKVIAHFLPVEGSERMVAPRDCFTSDGAALFGFSILRRGLHPHASKLGVKQHPSIGECLDILIKKPPTTKRDARSIFSYMAGRVGEISRADADRVGSAPIIPVSNDEVSEKIPRVRHVAPKLCYLGDSEDYGDIFDFVDFGQEANVFLMAVGSKPEPTKVEIARILVKEPTRISSKFQSPDKYLKLLRSLAEHVSVLKKDRELYSEMKKAPFVLASRELPSKASRPEKKDDVKRHTESDEEDIYAEEEQSIKEWQLTMAKDAVVVDDYQSYSLFKEHVLAAPQEEVLENFYISLGAPPLSSIVEEQAHWGSVSSDQRPAVKLQKLILERSRLFLHDQSPDSIKHDTRWLEKHLSVQVVHSISLRRSLRGRRASHTQKRSAIITQQARDYILWICPGKYDLYQISQALVHLMLARPKLHSTLTLEMLLKTDLLELRARGYNVERILKQKAQEARLAEDRRHKQLEEERKQLQEREAEWRRAQEQQAEEMKNHEAMPGLFPDSPQNSKTTHGGQDEQLDDSRDYRPRGLFSNLTRRLGLDDGSRTSKGIQSFLQGQSSSDTPDGRSKDTPPPPYTAEDPQKPKPQEPKPVTSPHMLQSNLLSAIQSCRPNGASSVYSRPEMNQVTESKSYCDERPSHDLEFAATLPSSINFLMAKSAGDRSAFLAENSFGINTFASILADCAGVFSLRLDSISIFYDPGGKTIAFNRGGSLFCNYHYFKQLHQTQVLQNLGSSRAEALVYWWVVLCHELAHNLVADHSSDHSYYTESFVAQYFAKVVAKLSASPSVSA